MIYWGKKGWRVVRRFDLEDSNLGGEGPSAGQEFLSCVAALLSAPGREGPSAGQGFLPCAGRLISVPGRDRLSWSEKTMLQEPCGEASSSTPDADNSVLAGGTLRTDVLSEETLCNECDKQWSDEDSFARGSGALCAVGTGIVEMHELRSSGCEEGSSSV